MLNKRFFSGFIVLLVLLSALLFVIRANFVLNNVGNKDVYKDYVNVPVKTSKLFDTIKNEGNEKYLFVFNSSEEASIKIKENLEKLFSGMKKHVTYEDVKDTSATFEGYSCVILDFENFENFDYFDNLFKYVEKGGSVIIAERPIQSGNFSSIYRKLGIYERGTIDEVKGMKMLTNVLLKGKGAEDSTAVISSIAVQLDNDCKVYSVSSDNRPLIWEKKIGTGKVIFSNGQFFVEKENRGLFAGILGQIETGFIYPVMNMKLSFIDDFPAPIPIGYNERIFKDYGKDASSFFSDIWWPDMLKSSKQYDTKYSTFYIEVYNNRVSPNFDIVRDQETRNTLLRVGHEIIKSGGEIGIHGYNHQSLVFKGFMKVDLGYNSWPNINNMEASLKEVNNYFHTVFPNYNITSYVPPSNIISDEGIEALHNSMPDLKIISSVFQGGLSGDEYVQEFEKSDDGFLQLPRISSGYKYTSEKKWSIYNGITAYGTFSHFLHPDDILDSSRSLGISWEDMYRDYNGMMKDIHNNFNWLRSMTISKGGVELSRYLDTETEFKYSEKNIKGYSKNFRDQMYFILRTDKKISKCTGCSFTKIDDNAYLIKAIDSEFNIETEGAK